MRSILRFKRLPVGDRGYFGYERIDVVAFNIDGEGSALLRAYPKDKKPFLMIAFGDDLICLLEGDDGGFYEYEEVENPNGPSRA